MNSNSLLLIIHLPHKPLPKIELPHFRIQGNKVYQHYIGSLLQASVVMTGLPLPSFNHIRGGEDNFLIGKEVGPQPWPGPSTAGKAPTWGPV